MKEKFEIEEFALEIKEALNLLKCFDEFCDESVLTDTATEEERLSNAIWFVKRLETHHSLLSVSIKTISSAINSLNQKFNINL